MGKIAIIGGSGIKDCPVVESALSRRIDTRFRSRDTGLWERIKIRTGIQKLGHGVVEYQDCSDFLFIGRHGNERRYGPSTTQYGANLIAAKMLGATAVIAFSAVGSLKNEIPVRSLVVPDGYVDESGRNDNLFGEGLVVHCNPRPAFSDGLRNILIEDGEDLFKSVHNKAVYVTIPGDRFGTTAEGKKRSAYADIVGMTVCPEASMAMQLGLHYACAAFPVDMDQDASHEEATLKIMHELGGIVPEYVSRVLESAKQFAKNPPLLKQLEGNIIPGDTGVISNPYLRKIANELIRNYCK